MCRDDESLEHMVMGCKWTKPVWTEMLGVRREGAQVPDITLLDERMRERGGTRNDQGLR